MKENIETIIKEYIEGESKDYCKLSRLLLTDRDCDYLCSNEFREKTQKLIKKIKENKLQEKITLFRSQKVVKYGIDSEGKKKRFVERRNILTKDIIYDKELYVGAIIPMGISSFSSNEDVVDNINKGYDSYIHDFDKNLNRDRYNVKFKITTDEALPIYQYAGKKFKYQEEFLMYGYFQIVKIENDGTYILEKINENNIGKNLISLKQDKHDLEYEIRKQKRKIEKLEKN